jgi:hypothetical protein
MEVFVPHGSWQVGKERAITKGSLCRHMKLSWGQSSVTREALGEESGGQSDYGWGHSQCQGPEAPTTLSQVPSAHWQSVTQ